MRLKGVFAGRSGWFQLLIFLLCLLGGMILANLISLLLYGVGGFSPEEALQNVHLLRLSQFIAAVTVFLCPALATAWLCSDRPVEYLSVGKLPDRKVFLPTLLSVALLSPVITLLGFFNQKMVLPSFLEPLERWMQSLEAAAESLTLRFFADNDPLSILLNVAVIAAVAGITEEFLFRGALQRILEKRFTSHHTVIWIAAVVFSTVHMQFYGFLPRLLLGAYFGYLLYWTRSIWVPVFAHFVHNGIAVAGMSKAEWRENEFVSGEISGAGLPPLIICSLLSLFLFYFCVVYLRKSRA
ncbi:MAG: CPBP family intramembrane metalloprotease [Tannerellaceae bacterium]|jgi:membrane protease YdiL (CAAX protease family)|nr:CPBP family intramembrane metalloprotease [Tannerellaceae bacterium]